jgi:putative ABC transport system substrate-binding protein
VSRSFSQVLLLPVIVLAGALAPVHAQQPGRVYRLGWLGTPQNITAEGEKLLLDQLSSQGFVDGKNLSIVRKGSETNREQQAAFARELVFSKPDVLLTAGTPNTRLLQSATSTIPIVFLGAADPVASGLVKSLAHPGGNITGISNQQCAIAAKAVELAHELVPKAKRVSLVAGGTPERNACAASFVALVAADASIDLVWADPYQVEATAVATTVRAVAKRKPDIVVMFGPQFDGVVKSLNEGGGRKVPIVCTGAEGCAVLINFDLRDLFRITGDLIAKILSGTPPGDLPVAQPQRYRMDVNLGVAKAQGVRVPESVLLRANRIVQ